MALSKKPVKGMKDVMPDEMRIRNYVINKLTFTLIQLLNDLTYYESMLINPLKPNRETSVVESFKSIKKRKKHLEG